jgi:nucleoside 2-deoxyribosyltransferase
MFDDLIKTICPICKLADNDINRNDSGDKFTINCPRCKRFTISGTAKAIAERRELGPKLSAWIRNRNEQGAEIPEINSKSLEEIQAGLPDYSPREKQIILLKNIERKTEYPGQRVVLNYIYDFPLAWASGDEEFLYYIRSLQERGFLSSDILTGLCRVTITGDGWDYLEKVERHIEERTQAFVAMSFSDDLKFIWEGPLFNAITKAGYKPYRVDAEPHIDRIDAKIISEIKNSRFVVADVTGQKLGVYFEAGYAIGLGLPVLWCVRKDELEKVHFDTRQYNHIVWETADDLETQLYDFICAIIGKGKEA